MTDEAADDGIVFDGVCARAIERRIHVEGLQGRVRDVQTASACGRVDDTDGSTIGDTMIGLTAGAVSGAKIDAVTRDGADDSSLADGVDSDACADAARRLATNNTPHEKRFTGWHLSAARTRADTR